MMATEIVIAWDGMPSYAASAIEVARTKFTGRIAVLSAGEKTGLVEDPFPHLQVCRNETASWGELGLSCPRVFLHTGWSVCSFNRLAGEVRTAGGKIIALVDNRWTGSAIQRLKIIAFRVLNRNRFDGAWVPGNAGVRLVRAMGIPDDRIHRGLYAVSEEKFSPGAPSASRTVDLLFVGQLIERKGLLDLAEVASRIRASGIPMRIAAMGSGPLAGLLTASGIEVLPHQGSFEVARVMRQSRFLILPSWQDNWGVVVLEAAMSRCGLILSSNVGAAEDFAGFASTWLHRARSVTDFHQSIIQATTENAMNIDAATAQARNFAQSFSDAEWVKTLASIRQRY